MISAKRLLNKLKHPEQPGMLWVLFGLGAHNMPDVNPLDYYISGLDKRASKKHPNNKEGALKANIVDVMTNIPRAQLIARSFDSV